MEAVRGIVKLELRAHALASAYRREGNFAIAAIAAAVQ